MHKKTRVRLQIFLTLSRSIHNDVTYSKAQFFQALPRAIAPQLFVER
jgi:hypothetical protein